MGLHPAFDRRVVDDFNINDAAKYFSVGSMTVDILKDKSCLIQYRIEEIKSGNNKISIREMNKLNKELYTINKNIEEIEERILAFHIVFNNIDIGTSH
jgi:hypothetical protein